MFCFRQSQRRYYFQLMKNILLSRHRLLSAAASLPPGAPLPRLQPVGPASSSSTSSPIYQKVRHRYFKELESIKQEIGESSQSSEDESFPGNFNMQWNQIQILTVNQTKPTNQEISKCSFIRPTLNCPYTLTPASLRSWINVPLGSSLFQNIVSIVKLLSVPLFSKMNQ